MSKASGSIFILSGGERNTTPYVLTVASNLTVCETSELLVEVTIIFTYSLLPPVAETGASSFT